MTVNEVKYIRAYVAFKLAVTQSEPDPEKFLVAPGRAEQIARIIHREFELEKLEAARALNQKLHHQTPNPQQP